MRRLLCCAYRYLASGLRHSCRAVCSVCSAAFIAVTLIDVGVTVAASSAMPTSMHHLLFLAYSYPASGLRHSCRSSPSTLSQLCNYFTTFFCPAYCYLASGLSHSCRSVCSLSTLPLLLLRSLMSALISPHRQHRRRRCANYSVLHILTAARAPPSRSFLHFI